MPATHSAKWNGQAVILAAGIGSRLGKLTAESPKCMVQIGEMTIIERALAVLKSVGVSRVVVVTGFKRQILEDYLATLSNGLELIFVHNPDYATTNNIYSLWLAQPHIASDFLLIESDVLFTRQMIVDLLDPCATSVSPLQPWMNGTVLTLNADKQVSAIYLKNDPRPDAPLYKTVNLYSFDLKTWNEAVWPRLDRMVKRQDLQVYYEVAIAEAVREGDLRLRGTICDVTTWYEVDTPEDLKAAGEILPHAE